MNDLKFAFRQLLKNPGFTAVAVLTLALGIGASTAIFCWLNAMLLGPLPFPDADRLVLMSESWIEKGWGRSDVSAGTFEDWREQATSFDSMAAFEEAPFRMRSDQSEVKLRNLRATISLFEVLKVHPALGRGFLPEDGRPGQDRLVILSHDLWQGRFGSRSDIIGTSLELNGASFTVIGVMPDGFHFPYDTEIWTPLSFSPQELARRDRRSLRVVGRLKPNAALGTARAELSGITARIAGRFPSTNRGWGGTLEPLRVLYVGGDLRRTFSVLLGAAAFVLLAACANIANLLLARVEARQKEVAIRLSLGARRGRIVRQELAESLMLSVLGTAMGLLLAFWLSSAISALIPGYTVGGIRPAFDGRVLIFTVALCVVACLAFGTIPAWLLAQSSPGVLLTQSAGISKNSAGSGRWLNRWVVCEVTCAVTLTMGAGLMVLTLVRLTKTSLGFDPGLVLMAEVNPNWSKAEPDYSPRKVLYYEQLQAELSRGAGIAAAAIFRDDGWSDCVTEGRLESIQLFGAGCSTNLFGTLGVPLLRGRLFPEVWKKGDPVEVVINERFAQRCWPGENPLGKRFKPTVPGAMWITVVGVVRDFQLSRDREARPLFFSSYRGSFLEGVQLFLKADTTTTSAASSARQIIGRFDPDQTNCDVRTMNDVLGGVLRARYRLLVLLGGFAGISLLLATIGIYGVVSCLMARRRREVGIRIALGASRANVMSLVLRQGMVPVFVGIGCGALVSFSLGHFLASHLFGVEGASPVIFAGCSVLMLLAAILACLGPALRASTVDPLEALRHE